MRARRDSHARGTLVFNDKLSSAFLSSTFMVSPEPVEGSNHERRSLRQACIELAERLRDDVFVYNHKTLFSDHISHPPSGTAI